MQTTVDVAATAATSLEFGQRKSCSACCLFLPKMALVAEPVRHATDDLVFDNHDHEATL